MAKDSIGIGLIGLGVIGGQVARVLRERAALLAERTGSELALRRIKVLPADLERPLAKELPPSLFTTDEEEFFSDPEIDIMVELMGGEEPALDYQRRAISLGKHVVTANKEVIAKHGTELMLLAREHHVCLQYEASVGGGIPLVAPFKHDLVANELKGVYAIINGTTNYILTCMARDGMEFSEALKQAQQMGYAEADPQNDVEGIDARYKLAILATLAFQTRIKPEDVYSEGISRLGASDFRYARELGFAIKLLAIAKQDDDVIEARVHPVFIPQDSFLAKVDGVYNAILVEGDLVNKVLFFGEGAGALPTSSAVIGDIVATAQNINRGLAGAPRMRLDTGKRIMPMAEVETRYYLRLNIADRPGVLAQIARTFGDNHISISSAIQLEANVEAQTAEIVIMTHPAREKSVQEAIGELDKLEAVKEISNCIRVENI